MRGSVVHGRGSLSASWHPLLLWEYCRTQVCIRSLPGRRIQGPLATFLCYDDSGRYFRKWTTQDLHVSCYRKVTTPPRIMNEWAYEWTWNYYTLTLWLTRAYPSVSRGNPLFLLSSCVFSAVIWGWLCNRQIAWYSGSRPRTTNTSIGGERRQKFLDRERYNYLPSHSLL